MRCIALLSGGKDSVAAIDVARGHGFDVVACLRLLPSQDDAYMFHTPNLAPVEGIAECLGIPLLSASTRPDPLEEVDDLEQALARAVNDFNADAIVSGALASEYQRTRIDQIGHRLGVKTFAPLWHKDRRAYLSGLIAAGYEIRFSRVAADGLGPEWAGQRLDAEALGRLATMRSRPDIAGEGGEYETIVLAGPGMQGSVHVDASHVEATASRATWIIDEWQVERS